MNRMSAVAIAAALASLVGFGPASAFAQASSAEKPVAAEKNPPGDVPDNQVFIDYRSPLGFNIKVPEGWARRETSDAPGLRGGDLPERRARLPIPHRDPAAPGRRGDGGIVQAERGVRLVRMIERYLPQDRARCVSITLNARPGLL